MNIMCCTGRKVVEENCDRNTALCINELVRLAHTLNMYCLEYI